MHTVGVQRQYTGTAGRIENSQVAVYLTYATNAGHALIDRALYLPKSWCEDTDRREAAGVPDGVEFATKPALAKELIVAALESGAAADWVAGDEVYGADPGLRTELAGSHADLLEAAAFVHDIGYAPDLVDTGFHPIDGANYLAAVGMPARLVNLVAHHSYAVLEAELRGLLTQLEPFEDERGLIRDALWYCDQTTGPGGERVSARERHAEIKQRYGPGHLVTEFIERGAPELLAAVDRTEQRLAALCEPR